MLEGTKVSEKLATSSFQEEKSLFLRNVTCL